MPLLAKMDSSRQDREQHSLQQLQHRERDLLLEVEDAREERHSDYEEFEEFDIQEEDECVDSDMDGSIIHRGRPKKPVKAAPAVPQRSEKRTSMLLQNVMLELQNLDGSRPKEADKISLVQESDPHELYLSSEEDASLSDDYDDFLTDFEDGDLEKGAERESTSRASSRKSQEDTARVVSFVMVGKPQIVDIYVASTAPTTSPSSNNPLSRLSLNLQTLVAFNSGDTVNFNPTPTSPSQTPKSTRRPAPLKLYPAIRRMSISSITSSHFSVHSPSPSINTITSRTYAASTTNLPLPFTSTSSNNAPPRKSSRLHTNLTSLVTTTKASLQSASHSFLNSDPFATPISNPTSTSYIPSTPNTYTSPPSPSPKTPTTSTLWRKSLSKTLRKPSMPKISLAYTAGVVTPRPESTASKVDLQLPAQEKADEDKIRYQDILKAAGEVIKSPSLYSSATAAPAGERRERGVRALGRLVRSKSGKGRGGASQLV